MIFGLALLPGEWQTVGLKKKNAATAKLKCKPKSKTKAREDTNQIAHRVMQEVIKRSES